MAPLSGRTSSTATASTVTTGQFRLAGPAAVRPSGQLDFPPVSTHAHPPVEIRVPSGEAAAYGPVGRSRWLDVDWREHQRWIVVDGQPVNTIELGEGPPLVFLHGLSGCWQNWLEQLPVFAEAHRVVSVDLPGFGQSPMPHE